MADVPRPRSVLPLWLLRPKLLNLKRNQNLKVELSDAALGVVGKEDL